jgi:hypothetical protein
MSEEEFKRQIIGESKLTGMASDLIGNYLDEYEQFREKASPRIDSPLRLRLYGLLSTPGLESFALFHRWILPPEFLGRAGARAAPVPRRSRDRLRPSPRKMLGFDLAADLKTISRATRMADGPAAEVRPSAHRCLMPKNRARRIGPKNPSPPLHSLAPRHPARQWVFALPAPYSTHRIALDGASISFSIPSSINDLKQGSPGRDHYGACNEYISMVVFQIEIDQPPSFDIEGCNTRRFNPYNAN